MSDLSISPSTSGSDMAIAREALKKIEGAGDNSGCTIEDQFTQAAAGLTSPGAQLVASVTCAAAKAGKDKDSASAIYMEGLKALASGAVTGAAPLAGLVLRLMNSGFCDNRAQNKTSIAGAALTTIAQDSRDGEAAQQALMMKSLLDTTYYWNSSISGLETALGAIAGGTLISSSVLKKAAAWITGGGVRGDQNKRMLQLKKIASLMVAGGIEGDKSDDRRKMALKAVEHLASPGAGADIVCRMAQEVIAGMRFTDTSCDVAVAALEQLPGQDPAALAGTASLFMGRAFAGNHSSGKWIDEKTPLAQACLRFIAGESKSSTVKECALLAAEMVGKATFTNSGIPIATLAFTLLGSGKDPGDRDMALFARSAVEQSLATNNSSGHWQDDKSPVARLAADWFATHAATPDGRAWGELLKCALDPGKFTNSNVAIARAGLDAIAGGVKAGPAEIAAVVRKMLSGSENTENSSGKFQADKSTVLNAVIPHLKKTMQGPEKRAVEMLEKATDNTHFARTYEQLALSAMQAIEQGCGTDRELAALAGKFVTDAYAGTDSRYAYKDDKTVVALQAAQYLEQSAQDPDVKYLSSLLLKALDRSTFTETCGKVATIAFDAMKKGEKGTDQAAAKLGKLMVESALASTTSSGKYCDDKTVVAMNILSLLKSTSQDKMTAVMASMLYSTIDACHFTESTSAIALSGFKALSHGGITRKDIADAAGDAIDRAINSTSQGRQDKGPAAVAIFKSLSESGMGCSESTLALEVASAMMDTGADYLERVKVAHSALDLWGSAGDPGIIDTGAFISTSVQAAKNAQARYKMLSNGVMVLAKSKGPRLEAEAKDRIKAAESMSTYEEASGFLLKYIQELASCQSAKQAVKELAKALSPEHPPEKQVVEEDEFVLIGGVRLKKQGEK